MNKILPMVVGMLLGANAFAVAVDPTPPASPEHDSATMEHGRMMSDHRMLHGRFAGPIRDGFDVMAILHQLELSKEQHDSIRALHEKSRAEGEHLRDLLHADRKALLTVPPTDPAYGAAVSAAKEHAAAMVAYRAELWSHVFGVLTPAQRARIPQIAARFDADKAGVWHRGPGERVKGRRGEAADGPVSPAPTLPESSGPR